MKVCILVSKYFILEMKFVYGENEIKIHQSKYNEKILTKFNMD